jgi:hypothetical protein
MDPFQILQSAPRSPLSKVSEEIDNKLLVLKEVIMLIGTKKNSPTKLAHQEHNGEANQERRKKQSSNIYRDQYRTFLRKAWNEFVPGAEILNIPGTFFSAVLHFVCYYLTCYKVILGVAIEIIYHVSNTSRRLCTISYFLES